MKNAQIPGHVSLGTLINRLKEGRYVVPDFQREFEWAPWDINDLVRSIFLDYYIGSLLLWKAKPDNLSSLSCESIYGFSGTPDPAYIVLDGQQRLTALHYAFVAPNIRLPQRANRALYHVRIDRFMNEEYEKAFEYDWSTRAMLALLNDREAQYREHIFPCSMIGASTFALANWMNGYVEYWKTKAESAEAGGSDAIAPAVHAARAKEFSSRLEALVGEYQVSYIELDQDLDIAKVCDIFTKLNSTGVRLDIFDLLNALLKPKDIELKDLYRTEKTRLGFYSIDRINVYILQVMSILKQDYCSSRYIYYLLPKQVRRTRHPDGTREDIVLIQSREEFLAAWTQAVEALDESIRLLRHPQEFGAVTKDYLPYAAILPIFAAIQAHIKERPASLKFSGERKARRWYWASVFMQRYSDAVESTSAKDFIDFRRWITDDAAEPEFISAFRQQAGSIRLREEQRRTTSVYKGIFNLLVIGGARDWITGKVPHFKDLDDHHIVPASWGAKNQPTTSINTILNRTPLSSETNRAVIRDRLPNVYLREMIDHIGQDATRSTLASHLISPEACAILLRDPFTIVDYEEFITERQRTILQAISDLLVDDQFDLSPDLRELDARIEQIEIRLREIIDDRFYGDLSKLPQHVMDNSKEKVQRAERRDPVFDSVRYGTLAGRLEFCDLRELQDILVGKTNWPMFEPRFLNKETLAVKFNQLAALRNGLAHNRSVDEITRKEGEAAILWFDHVLKKQV